MYLWMARGEEFTDIQATRMGSRSCADDLAIITLQGND